MIIAKNDEVKRSKIWRIVTTVSSVLFIIIAIYLLTKLFMTNPLEGDWTDEDGNLSISISRNGTAMVTLLEVGEAAEVTVPMNYTLDRDAKTITITAKETDFRSMAEKSDGQYTEGTLKNALDSVITTFDYSVDQEQLTLTEREYGEQMILIKE